MAPLASFDRFTRRRFLQRLCMTGFAAAVSPRLLAFSPHPRTESPASSQSSVVLSPARITPGAYDFLPLGAIQPRGWLLTQLRIQADGLSGHLDETWDDVGPNSGWLGGTGESWERGPYFLDGLIPLAWLLDDAVLKAKAQKFVDWTLTHQAPSGMIGPSSNDDWWPRMVMLKALTQYQEFTGDSRVIPVMEKYLRYQLAQLPSRPLRDWGKFRWQDELLTVVWLYSRTGSIWLLDLARLLHQQGYDWTSHYAQFHYTQPITENFLRANAEAPLADLALATHGVNNGQAIKTGPVWSLISGSTDDRQAVFAAIAALDRYHGLPNGMFSCDEHLAGLDPSHGSELCTVVEYMFSLEQSLAITGDPRSAIVSRSWPSTHCPVPSPTICGRTSTTRSPIRSSAACIESPGLPTDPSPISTASSPTSDAAPQTSVRDGPNSPTACFSARAILTIMATMGLSRPSMRRARFEP
jgi:hypothetical protein